MSSPTNQPPIKQAQINQPEWFKHAVTHKRESFYVEVENCKIHYQKWMNTGAEASLPVLLFVHGGGAHSHWWDFIAPSFRDEYQVLALDLSGMGDSEHRDSYSDSLYAKELLAVCQHAGYENDISIISHSYGGRSVLTLALEKPEVIRWMIIADCKLISLTERGEMMGKVNLPESPFGEKKVYPSKVTGLQRFKLMPPQSCQNQYLVDYLADYSIGQVEEGWSWKFDMNFIPKRDETLVNNSLLDEIYAIKCPVANVYGEDSMLFPEELIDMYKEKYPANTPFYCLANAKHHLLLDQPESFIAMLKSMQQEFESNSVELLKVQNSY